MRTALALFVSSIAFAQEFDVASIKSAGAPAPNGVVMIGPALGGPGSGDPTHITWNGATLFQILQTAYDVKNYQIEGPDWVRSERYDFAVAVPEGATKEQVAIMWRKLLTSRFDMSLHKVQKEFPVDELVVGPRGHKLTENTEAIPGSDTRLVPPRPDKEGKIKLAAPGMIVMVQGNATSTIARAIGRAQPISELVSMLSNRLGHPVIDQTGLTSRYDFAIEYEPRDMPTGLFKGLPPSSPEAAPEVGMDLAGAVQQQLGLRLVKSKGMLDVIVVDKAEKVPSEN
jgi:uncharacterized protein (TIGR03435 family)